MHQEGILCRIVVGDFAEIWAGKRFFGKKPVLGHVLTDNIFPVRLQGYDEYAILIMIIREIRETGFGKVWPETGWVSIRGEGLFFGQNRLCVLRLVLSKAKTLRRSSFLHRLPGA